MIQIKDKSLCSGCTACAGICPKSCITMIQDNEGFSYPTVDNTKCVECGLCERTCPIQKKLPVQRPLHVYAAVNKDTFIRKQSSSGGVFSAIAESVIKHNGVVFGAVFSKGWKVVHTYVETIEDLSKIRGSKYVQSSIGESYKQCESFLKDGREVVFSGTPCQIAGLHSFLRKDYENLIMVDVICHGVPSPGVWENYLKLICPKGIDGENSVLSLKEQSGIAGISFRDKRAGWRKYGFSAYRGATKGSDENTVFPPKRPNTFLYEIQQENLFLRGFLQNLYLRPSCHNCQFRNFKSGSDLTLADFWGVERVFSGIDDDKGTSLVIIKTPKAQNIIREANVVLKEVQSSDYNMAFSGNSSMFTDDTPNVNRDLFFKEWRLAPNELLSHITKYTCYNLRRKHQFDHFLMTLGIYDFIKYMVKIVRR